MCVTKLHLLFTITLTSYTHCTLLSLLLLLLLPAYQSVSVSVRQCVCPSVRRSVSVSVRQCVCPSVRRSVSVSVCAKTTKLLIIDRYNLVRIYIVSGKKVPLYFLP